LLGAESTRDLYDLLMDGPFWERSKLAMAAYVVTVRTEAGQGRGNIGERNWGEIDAE